tara:strand:+ start:172 stop:465 length:294 start_codon:yes stop_codon:yes gene_type:complete
MAQNSSKLESQPPKAKTEFRLHYEDIDDYSHLNLRGNVLVRFKVNTAGKVVEPEIVDSFNTILNETIIDKVLAIQFEPALQNGNPVEVRYMLPILFK